VPRSLTISVDSVATVGTHAARETPARNEAILEFGTSAGRAEFYARNDRWRSSANEPISVTWTVADDG
jgi:hypothetical protein